MEDMDYQPIEPDEVQDETALVHQPQTAAPMPFQPSEWGAGTIERAHEMLDIYNQLKIIAFKALDPKDFVDLGGKPYLTEAGCMKFAGIYGVSFKDIQVTPSDYTDDIGPVREFTAQVTAVFQNRQDTEWGMSSSAEKFFQRQGKRLPLSEVKTADVMKKAITNAKGRAVRKILGLTFTWEQVRDNFAAAGKDAGKMTSVEYKGQKQTNTGKGEVNATKRELSEMLMTMTDGSAEEASKLLYEHSKFIGKDGKEHGARSARDMSNAWATRVYAKVKKIYTQFMEETEK